jgi:hypothetical protein
MTTTQPVDPVEPGKLTLIGYWLGPGELEWPDVRNSVDPSWDEEERQTVIAHLRKGTEFRAFLGISICRICTSPNGVSEQTDGTYYWPEGLAHYLAKHDVRLPQLFAEHVLAGRKVRPQVRRRDAEHAPLSVTWWRGQTWQKRPALFGENDYGSALLEVVRQQFAWWRCIGQADEIERNIAEGKVKSARFMLQGVIEAQREHELRYGPPIPPIPGSRPE